MEKEQKKKRRRAKRHKASSVKSGAVHSSNAALALPVAMPSPPPPKPFEIAARLLKSNPLTAERWTEQIQPKLRLIPFPGSLGTSIIAHLEANFSAHASYVAGFQVVPDEEHPEVFSFFNLITENEIPLYAGKRAQLLFLFDIPSHYKNFRILFTNGDGTLTCLASGKSTSEGRTFDILEDFRAAPFSAQNTTPPLYLFVGGPPKSGSTWMEKVLGAHPNIFCKGEGNFFMNDFLGFITSHNHWFPASYTQEEYADLCRAAVMDHLFKTYHSLWPTRIMADRSPAYTYTADKAMRAFPQARYIHCSRHPLDVAVSRLFHHANLLNSGIRVFETIPFTEEENAFIVKYAAQHVAMKKGSAFAKNWDLLRKFLDEWVRAEMMYERLAAAYPGQVFSVCYEDMLADFDKEAARMFAFLDLAVDEALLRGIRSMTDFRALSGGRGSGEEDRTSFFRKGVAQDYLNHFTPGQVETALAYIEGQKKWHREQIEAGTSPAIFRAA